MSSVITFHEELAPKGLVVVGVPYSSRVEYYYQCHQLRSFKIAVRASRGQYLIALNVEYALHLDRRMLISTDSKQ
jgi:hypothetical protein